MREDGGGGGAGSHPLSYITMNLFTKTRSLDNKKVNNTRHIIYYNFLMNKNVSLRIWPWRPPELLPSAFPVFLHTSRSQHSTWKTRYSSTIVDKSMSDTRLYFTFDALYIFKETTPLLNLCSTFAAIIFHICITLFELRYFYDFPFNFLGFLWRHLCFVPLFLPLFYILHYTFQINDVTYDFPFKI